MNNPFNFFDKVYCINLSERTDRWNECLKNFEKYEIYNYERIDGVKVEANLPSKRKAQIGCALSFATCFEKMKKENLKNVLLFEDDFEFKYDKEILFEKLNNSLKDLPEDWDSLFLGGTVVNNYGFFPIEKYSDNLFKLNSAHCLHATAFSRKGILKIFDSFDNKIDWHKELINNYENMDVFMAKTYQHKTKSFLTSDLLCYQRISVSNIESAIYDYSEWMDRNFNYFKSLL